MKRIRKRDLIVVFFRSFFIQAAWNYERMLSLGFCYCLIPIAKRLFDNEDKVSEFLKRHLDFFNSHPYMANYALGAVANIEQQAIIKNWDDSKPVEVFKKRVIGPLGAIGDTLFWQLLLPFLGVVGVVSLIFFKIWGALVFLLIYNFFHISARIRGLTKSYQKGFDIIRDLSFRGTTKFFKYMQYSFTSILGVALVFFVSYTHSKYALNGVVIFGISALFSFFANKKQRLSIDLVLIIVVIGALIIGLIVGD